MAACMVPIERGHHARSQQTAQCLVCAPQATMWWYGLGEAADTIRTGSHLRSAGGCVGRSCRSRGSPGSDHASCTCCHAPAWRHIINFCTPRSAASRPLPLSTCAIGKTKARSKVVHACSVWSVVSRSSFVTDHL